MCVRMCVCVCVCVCVCMYVCMEGEGVIKSVCMYMCMYIYIYIYMAQFTYLDALEEIDGHGQYARWEVGRVRVCWISLSGTM